MLHDRAIVKWLKLHGYTVALTLTSLYVIAFVFVPFVMEVLK
jgi:hypothetical protein